MPAPERWWVMQPIPGRGQPSGYVIRQGVTRPDPSLGTVAAGPFTTRADAQAWIKAQAGSGITLPDLSIPNPFSWTGAIAHWAGKLVLDVTDIHTWISLGWLALGSALIIFGVYLWFRTSSTYAGIEDSIIGAAGKL